MAIGRAFVDVESGKLKFQVNTEEVNFNVCKSMKQPNELQVVLVIEVINEANAYIGKVTCIGRSLEVVLLNYDG